VTSDAAAAALLQNNAAMIRVARRVIGDRVYQFVVAVWRAKTAECTV